MNVFRSSGGRAYIRGVCSVININMRSIRRSEERERAIKSGSGGREWNGGARGYKPWGGDYNGSIRGINFIIKYFTYTPFKRISINVRRIDPRGMV